MNFKFPDIGTVIRIRMPIIDAANVHSKTDNLTSLWSNSLFIIEGIGHR